MYCKYCGFENKKAARFCKNCGEQVIRPRSKRSRKFRLVPRVLIVLAAGGFLWYLNTGLLSSRLNVFPFWPTNPKTTTLSCSYAGKNLKTDITLYGNINNYYRGYEYFKKDGYLKNDQYDKFVFVNPRDKTIKNLVQNIKNIASDNKLNDDQTLELATCFVQNIPYDNNKAESVLKGSGNTAATEQYPYQTLFNDKGICTDKTYLGSVLIGGLGYGTGIMSFNDKNHMALGISVPPGYTSFNSKYLYTEMTTIMNPGLIPSDIDPNNGFPFLFANALKSINAETDPSSIELDSSKTISAPNKVVEINMGKQYSRIVDVKNIWNSINFSLVSLVAKKAALQTAHNNISYWDKIQSADYSIYLSLPTTTQTCYPTYTYYPYYSSHQNCYTSPNFQSSSAYSTYLNAFNRYKAAVADYNNLVDDYNLALEKINSQIDRYQSYQYN